MKFALAINFFLMAGVSFPALSCPNFSGSYEQQINDHEKFTLDIEQHDCSEAISTLIYDPPWGASTDSRGVARYRIDGLQHCYDGCLSWDQSEWNDNVLQIKSHVPGSNGGTEDIENYSLDDQGNLIDQGTDTWSGNFKILYKRVTK